MVVGGNGFHNKEALSHCQVLFVLALPAGSDSHTLFRDFVGQMSLQIMADLNRHQFCWIRLQLRPKATVTPKSQRLWGLKAQVPNW